MVRKDLEQLAQIFPQSATQVLTSLDIYYADSDEKTFKEQTGMTFKQAEKSMEALLETLEVFRV